MLQLSPLAPLALRPYALFVALVLNLALMVVLPVVHHVVPAIHGPHLAHVDGEESFLRHEHTDVFWDRAKAPAATFSVVALTLPPPEIQLTMKRVDDLLSYLILCWKLPSSC